jgi:hypothetical protein
MQVYLQKMYNVAPKPKTCRDRVEYSEMGEVQYITCNLGGFGGMLPRENFKI